jgi:hypothetical protein
MTEIIGEHRGAESGRESNAGVLILAFCRGGAMGRSHCRSDQRQDSRRKTPLRALV